MSILLFHHFKKEPSGLGAGDRLSFDEFKVRVYAKRALLEQLGVDGDWDEGY